MLGPTTRLPSDRAAPAQPTGRRADIQGLRALAVLLVIGDHLLGKPRGGFVGVDVFFVISGFLITGLLLREHARTGRISLLQFYKRRIKRIGPAAVVVLLAVVGVSLLLMSPTRRGLVRGDAVWALLSAGNWRMIAIGTDYMHATDAVSPLQHYWSLAVEEQFYLAWPLLLIGALALGRRGGSGRRAAALAVGLVVVLSFGYGWWQSATQPTAAYFSTLSRGWELGVGALLALLAPRLERVDAAGRALLGWGGLALIGYSALHLTGSAHFPVPDALLPVAGAAAVIASGIGEPAPHLGVLSGRAAQWLGERSYSLYLWHFPVIVFVATLLPQRGGRFWVLALALTVLLATLSHRFIEEPFRQRSWRLLLRPIPRRLTRPRLTAAALLSVAALATTAFVWRTPLVVKPLDTADLTSNVVASSAETQREDAVARALRTAKWPALHPDPRTVTGDARVPEWLVDGCLGDEHHALPDPVENARRCVYGNPNGSRTAMLLGDSTAISWMPGLRRALGPDWRIEVWTDQQCPAVAVAVKRGDGSISPHCDELRTAATAEIARTRPAITILTSSPGSLGRLVDGLWGAPAVAEWQRATAKTIAALAPKTGKLVVLDPPPDMQPLQDCVTPISTPADCLSPVGQQYLDVSRAQRAAVASLSLPNVSYPDTLPWFCLNGRCPSFAAGSPTLADGRHLTAATSLALAPVLRSVLAHSPISARTSR